MSRIMFNDRYGLHKAVMEGCKTMTRRVVRLHSSEWGMLKKAFEDVHGNKDLIDGFLNYYAKYKVGEVVAIAQSYKSICAERPTGTVGDLCCYPGWKNKMFVREDLMPHHIKITDRRLERLQGISDEDCLKEGVEPWLDSFIVPGIMERGGRNNICFQTPREAFAALIDRTSGRGTWNGNPFTVAYCFERID